MSHKKFTCLAAPGTFSATHVSAAAAGRTGSWVAPVALQAEWLPSIPSQGGQLHPRTAHDTGEREIRRQRRCHQPGRAGTASRAPSLFPLKPPLVLLSCFVGQDTACPEPDSKKGFPRHNTTPKPHSRYKNHLQNGAASDCQAELLGLLKPGERNGWFWITWLCRQ